MSLLDDFVAASDAYDALLQSLATQYNELTADVKAIDASSSSAQDELDKHNAITAEAYNTAIDKLVPIAAPLNAADDAAKSYSGPDRDSILAGIAARKAITTDNLAATVAMGKSRSAASDAKQTEINAAKKVTETTTETPTLEVGGLPPNVATAKPQLTPQQIERTGASTAPSLTAKKQNPGLSNFIANLKSRGLPTASHYYVQIMGIKSREVWMMCEQAILPGVNVMTAEIRTYGELRESPYGVTYQPANLTFLLDNSMDGKRLFEDWSNRIFNRATRTAGYYDDYIGSVRIFQTDADSNVVYGVELKEAFPKTIQDINLGYENKELLKLNVSMAFKYWVEIDYLGKTLKSAEEKAIEIEKTEKLKKDMNRKFSVPTEQTVPKGADYDVGNSLVKSGEALTSMTGVASSQVAAAAVAAGQGGLAGAFSSLTNTIGQLGGGVAALGQGLTNVMAPVSQLGQAAAGVAGSLGAINGLLGGLGMGSPLTKAIGQFTKLGGQFGQIAGMNGLPSLINNTGSSLTGLAGTFNTLGDTFSKAPGNLSSLSKSVTNLGGILTGNGSQIINAASKMQ
jgi:hypothetical protein